VLKGIFLPERDEVTGGWKKLHNEELNNLYSSFFHSFIHSSMALQPFVGSWFLHFRDLFFTQSVGVLGRVISPSQGRYLHTRQHKHIINAHKHPRP
jgi:hypothetical protein